MSCITVSDLFHVLVGGLAIVGLLTVVIGGAYLMSPRHKNAGTID
jgi:hypothetical protein